MKKGEEDQKKGLWRTRYCLRASLYFKLISCFVLFGVRLSFSSFNLPRFGSSFGLSPTKGNGRNRKGVLSYEPLVGVAGAGLLEGSDSRLCLL